MGTILGFFLETFRYTFFLVFSYLFLIALGNLRRGYRPPFHPPKTRFLILIPAHNEERVIGALLRDIAKQKYPASLVKTVVVADNCSDGTAEVARQSGVLALERRSGGAKGKGQALQWALNQISWDYDACVIFDADNRVAPDFLQWANNALQEGYPLLQGYLATKNPNDNWLTRVLHIHQETINTLWHAGKQGLGLGNYLIGTGMVIERELLKEGWKAQTLTEDLEFTLQKALKGYKVLWLREAVVYDERPFDLKNAWRQQQRWMIGTWQCFLKYFWPILRFGLSRKRIDLLDLSVYLFTPAWFIINALYVGINLLNEFFPFSPYAPNPLLTLLASAFGVLYCAVGLRLARIKVLENLPYLAVYLILFPLLGTIQCFLGLLRIKESRWYHTQHCARLDPSLEWESPRNSQECQAEEQ